MSVKLMGAVWDLELEPLTKMVLLALADHANDDGECWPSRKKTAKKCGISLDTLDRRTASLEKMGYLVKKTAQRDNGSSTSNHYFLIAENILDPSRCQRPPLAAVSGHLAATVRPLESSLNHQLEPSTSLEPLAPSDQDHSEPVEVVASLTLNDKSLWQVPKTKAEEWQALFPAVDVPQALRSMQAWCMANPTKRKTKRGVERFVVSWLSKEQDKGGSRQPALSFKEQQRRETEQRRQSVLRANYEAAREFCGEEL